MNSLSNMATITAEEIVRVAELKGKDFRNIKTHQIRNFFNEITSLKLTLDKNALEPEVRAAVVLLKPKLAYATGRKPHELRPFYDFMEEAINGVLSQTNGENRNDFDKAVHNFIILIESVVAYHKFHGGREN